MLEKFKIFLILVFLGAILNESNAQLNIISPINKAVYQRNASSQANLYINGSFAQGNLSSIQARLINPVSGSALSGFDWTIIQSNPTQGVYAGALNNVPAGWYTLEVRSMRSGSQINISSISRVGIGDVFIIAGQSNAQGDVQMQYLSATSNKVVTHNDGRFCNPNDLNYPVFTELLETIKPSPNGQDAWCYGVLGDQIVAETGFPVAFFNAGAAGTSVMNWKETSDNISVNHPITGFPYCASAFENDDNPGFVQNNPSTYASKNPYFIFKKTLNYYSSMFGTRSVIWHQGESDNYLGTTSADYTSTLNYVINKSRADYASTLPWMVSRVSYFNGINYAVRDGQNNTINTANQVFAGPDTDEINNTNPAYANTRDGINLHFFGVTGINALATAWKSAINTSFFSNSTPVSANLAPIITTSNITNSNVTLSVPNTYLTYKWIRTDVTGNPNISNVSEGNTNSIMKNSGTYRCWVGTANGNLQVSNEINVTQLLNLSNNGTSCSGDAFISDLNVLSAFNGLGPIEFNKTNGAAADGDGVGIVLKGVSYAKGLGVSPNSEIKYKLPTNQYYKFKSFIGVADDIAGSCNNVGGLIFKVYGDNNLLYTSPTIYRNSALAEADLIIYNYAELKLTVEAASPSAACNVGVWANARILCLGSDVTPPTSPSALASTDTLSKCISYQWTHATDNIQLAGYYIYKNGVLQDSVSYTQNTYTLGYLPSASNVTLGIQAYDLKKNLSAIVNIARSTKPFIVDYGDGDFQVCNNRVYLPISRSPSNGVFTLSPGQSNVSIGYSDGAFQSTVSGFYDYYYSINNGNPGCYDANIFTIGTTNPPTSTPVITTDKTLINIGTAVNLSSSACISDSLWWSFSSSISVNISNSPSVTTIYRAACRKLSCYNYSNNVMVKVLPNCQSNLVLSRPVDNLGSNVNAINFNSSNTINASNEINTSNNIQYNSANSILLLPGFKVNNGVKFQAKVQNCPN